MADTITDDVLDAILRESDGFWPPARERIQALIREHDESLIEELADKAEKSFDHAYDFEVDHDQDAYASGYRAGRRSVIRAVFKGVPQARQRREEKP